MLASRASWAADCKVAGARRCPAVAELDLGEEEDAAGPDGGPADEQRRHAEPEPRGSPSQESRSCRRRPHAGTALERGFRLERRRPGEEGGGEHHEPEARGQLPGPVDRRRDDARRQDRQGGAQHSPARAGRTPADAGDDREAKEPEDQHQADDAKLGHGLDEQRVSVADRPRQGAVLGPVGLVAPGADAADGVVLERVERRRPELIATAAPPAGQVGRDVGALRLQRLNLA